MARSPKTAANRTVAAVQRGPTAIEDEIYDLLTRAITTKKIRPGSRIREATLSAEFGVSRARVRRVLQRLADLDVVKFKLNLGAIVSRPTPEEAKAVFRTRRVLEVEAVAAVCVCAPRHERERLRALIDEERCAHENGVAGLTAVSSGVHIAIAQMCGNTVLAKLLDLLVRRCVLIQALYEREQQRTICLVDEHRDIVELIIAGRADDAVALMHRHIDHLEESLDYEGAQLDERLLASIG